MNNSSKDTGVGEALLLLAGLLILALCWRHIVHYLGGIS